MTKKFLYFQPEYVREFVCDGANCGDNCCERTWDIPVDAETFALYTRIQPADKPREITACFGYNAATKEFFLRDKPCSFLTEKKLCRLQLKYGEKFISQTCVTYPRRTLDFGSFFERSLVLSCPVAAEMILFNAEPMKFEFVEVTEPTHSHDGKLKISSFHAGQKFAEQMLEMQIAMISILQERTLTIDQRLIVLGFFLDKLDEIIFDGLDDDALTKLIAAYKSKKFLSTQVPKMFSAVPFDAEKFSELLFAILEKLSDEKFSAVKELLVHEKISAATLKNFTARWSTFMENFLVNELFMTCLPWKFQASVAKNFGVFVASYKIFELMTFAAAQQDFSRDVLLHLAVSFTKQADHGDGFTKVILDAVPDDIFVTLETLLKF